MPHRIYVSDQELAERYAKRQKAFLEDSQRHKRMAQKRVERQKKEREAPTTTQAIKE